MIVQIFIQNPQLNIFFCTIFSFIIIEKGETLAHTQTKFHRLNSISTQRTNVAYAFRWLKEVERTQFEKFGDFSIVGVCGSLEAWRGVKKERKLKRIAKGKSMNPLSRPANNRLAA